MKRVLILAVAVVLCACGGNVQKRTSMQDPDMHHAENSLDYAGIYTGTLPAADCPGIETRLVLYDDGCFKLHMNYIDRNTSFDERGKYTVAGDLLTLTPEEGAPGFYKVEENRLRMLGADRQPVTGELSDRFILLKQS